jgi:hypothetical protein
LRQAATRGRTENVDANQPEFRSALVLTDQTAPA